MIDFLLDNAASYPVLFVLCASSGILPIPEDVPVLLAGIATASGQASMPMVLIVAMAGVLVRDLIFYSVGRKLGDTLLDKPWFTKLIGKSRLEKAQGMVVERGPVAVLMGRFLIGFRTPVFVAAGAAGVSVRDFVLWDLLGLMVMVPGMFALGYVFGDPALVMLQWVLSNAWMLLAGPVALVICGLAAQGMPRPVTA